MKKLALIAGAAALVLPGAAFAKSEKAASEDSQYFTYKKVDTNAPSPDGEYRIEMQTEEDFRGIRGNSKTFTTLEGEKLQIEGKTVYRTAPQGNRFYAPNGAYPVQGGQVVVVEDGLLTRIEHAPEVVVLDMDRKNRNRM